MNSHLVFFAAVTLFIFTFTKAEVYTDASIRKFNFEAEKSPKLKGKAKTLHEDMQATTNVGERLTYEGMSVHDLMLIPMQADNISTTQQCTIIGGGGGNGYTAKTDFCAKVLKGYKVRYVGFPKFDGTQPLQNGYFKAAGDQVLVDADQSFFDLQEFIAKNKTIQTALHTKQAEIHILLSKTYMEELFKQFDAGKLATPLKDAVECLKKLQRKDGHADPLHLSANNTQTWKYVKIVIEHQIKGIEEINNSMLLNEGYAAAGYDFNSQICTLFAYIANEYMLGSYSPVKAFRKYAYDSILGTNSKGETTSSWNLGDGNPVEKATYVADRIFQCISRESTAFYKNKFPNVVVHISDEKTFFIPFPDAKKVLMTPQKASAMQIADTNVAIEKK